ncbi:phage tail tape measure protein [Bacillus sp. WMMC1349]|uniref:phage tail tape measure protein n=1 Tax=Bacillus sp. WMMC1349 TaxID=2736254 RepID=UPI0015524FCB|nr:phage tail tape measure protein [Bacillus sp. WMMC1349]NPC90968.1 phage tail tape measure protein [Bacillus sp. WMMC1349]NPC91021.1 phage tail tape measure protein [Bacillus sp. WMMC1349]NPC91066.1 phage tail tape measure protein [Bacillus sp. WMMC1349]NPC95005.1 phage tail tape measure protein [Bacillus sp. WMMC1349]
MAQPIGNMIVKVGLDDTGFNRGIEGLKRQMRLANSEMKASGAIYKAAGNQSKFLQSQIEGLNNKYQIQGRLVDEHRTKYNKLVREKGLDNRETQIQARRLNDAIAVHQGLGNELKRVTREFDNTTNSTRRAAGVFSVFKRNSGEVSKELNAVYQSATTAGKALSAIGAAGTVGIGLTVKAAADFEKAMSRVGALANATNEQMGELTETARHLGATTQFTDGQVAEGMQYLAMAGYKTNQIVGAMPGLLATAAAGQTELGVTADIVSDILTEFHIKAEDTNRVADAMTYTFTNSNATLQEIGQTMKYAAPAAKTAGLSMEELAAATGIMANSGIKADMAGTALRSTLTRLAAPPKQAGNAIDELGLKVTDSTGKLRPLADIIGQINEKTKNYTETEKIRIAKQIAGQHALSGFITLMHAGKDKLQDFTKEVENSGGTAEKVAKKQMDNLSGSLEYLKSATNNAVITLGNQFLPVIRATADGLTKMVTWFDSLPPSVSRTIAITGGAVTVFSLLGGAALLLLGSLPKMAAGWNMLRTAGGYLTRNVNRASTSLGVYSTEAIAAGRASRTAATGMSTTSTAANLASTRMNRFHQTTNLATTRVGRLEQSASRSTKVMRGLGGASRVAGLGLGMFGGPVGVIGGLLLSFAPELLKFGSGILKVGVNAVKGAGGFMRLAKSGFGLFNIIKKGVGIVGLLRGGLSLLGGPVGLAITGTTLLTEAGFKYYDNLKKRVLPATIDFGNGVSKSTSKAINAYEDMNIKITAKLNTLRVTNKKITKSIAEDVSKQFTDMGNSLKKGFQTSADTATKVLTDFYASNNKTSDKEAAKILNKIKNGNSKQQKEIQGYVNRVNQIYRKAAKEHRKTTDKENKEIAKIQRKMYAKMKTALSKSKDEQIKISRKLKEESSNLSAKQAAAVVRNSNKAKNKTIKAANDQFNAVVKAADDQYYVKGTITKKEHDDTVKKARDQKKNTISKAKETHQGVVKEAKKQATGHVSQVDWETGEVLGKWNLFIVDLARIINKITGGINKVLEFFHAPTIPEWKPKGYSDNDKKMQVAPGAAYAKGTNFHPGGQALVGEEGWELAHSPGIGTYMIGVGGPQILDLPRGTSVLPHAESKVLTGSGLPGYAGGVGSFFKGMISAGKNVVDKTIDVGSKAVELIKKGPGEFIKKLFKGLIPFKSGKGIDSIGTGIMKTIKDGAFQFLKGIIPENTATDSSSFKGTGGTKAVNQWVSEAANIAGVPPTWIPGLVTIAMKESGGNPNAINLWDSNAKAGHPSQGLMQTIPSTFNANKFPGHNNILNPVDNTLAAINYIKRRYGDIRNHPGLRSMALGGGYVGYAKGGISPGRGGSKWAILNERGFDETTITEDPSYRERNIGLWARIGSKLGVLPSLQEGMISKALVLLQKVSMQPEKERGSSNIPSVDISSIVQNQEKQINMMAKQIDFLNKNMQLLQQILLKESDTYLDGRKIDQSTGDRFTRTSFMNGVR